MSACGRSGRKKALCLLIAIGAVFVEMGILTTVISIILGIATKHRGWCVTCPMGTLQDKISKISGYKRYSSFDTGKKKLTFRKGPDFLCLNGGHGWPLLFRSVLKRSL